MQKKYGLNMFKDHLHSTFKLNQHIAAAEQFDFVELAPILLQPANVY